MSNTTYPTTLDTPTNPTATSKLNSPSHSAQHGFENDAIVALETKVGVDSSAVTTTLDYKVKNTASIDPGHKHTPSVSLATTGTPSATTFLRGDNVWSTVINKYGGDGSDAALNISAGVTTIDCANAAVVIKNYTSISITGTGQLAFSNPNANGTLIVLKSQGAITLTSSTIPNIDASGMGAAGGNGSVTSGASPTDGSDGVGQGIYTTKAGKKTTGSSTPAAGGATITTSYLLVSELQAKYPMAFVGSGGGGGDQAASGGGTWTGGAGGRGGAGLLIECGGGWNFTSTGGISVAGKNGGNGSVTGSPSGNDIATGGGGGGGGFCFVSYNTLTANSGTITTSGGTGGNNLTNSSPSSDSGGGGGGAIVAGSNSTASASNGAKTGGDGAVGTSLVIKNTEFS